MGFTSEQEAVIDWGGDARVNAVAGSGKTTTLVEYARRRPQERILYLAYNRSVKEEALRKFSECRNVSVETAHSLAYRGMGVGRQYVLSRDGNLKTCDVLDLCSIPARKGSVDHLVVARHVLNTLTMFFNSDIRQFDELDYPSSVTDQLAQKFVRKHEGAIFDAAKSLAVRMYRGNVPLVHDAYLKFFQLSNPELNHDCILFDEGQDASPVMLDIFLRQRGRKVIVGDSYQQIYRFRRAVNSLERVDFRQFDLSASFRFRQEIADLAMKVLSLRGKFGQVPAVKISGVGGSSGTNTRAVIARGNLALLDQAIGAVAEHKAKQIHFEGNLNTYTYMAEGASLYDVLYLFLGNTSKIRNEFIRSFSDFEMFAEYAEQAGDQEMSLVCKIVDKYRRDLFDYLRRLQGMQVERAEADIIFSTVHKAKGQEYQHVTLANDFLTGDKIDRIIQSAVKENKQIDAEALAEEVNIGYVAVTRTMNVLKMDFDFETGFPDRERGRNARDHTQGGRKDRGRSDFDSKGMMSKIRTGRMFR